MAPFVCRRGDTFSFFSLRHLSFFSRHPCTSHTRPLTRPPHKTPYTTGTIFSATIRQKWRAYRRCLWAWGIGWCRGQAPGRHTGRPESSPHGAPYPGAPRLPFQPSTGRVALGTGRLAYRRTGGLGLVTTMILHELMYPTPTHMRGYHQKGKVVDYHRETSSPGLVTRYYPHQDIGAQADVANTMSREGM